MEILGERWTVLVLREIFMGVRRFEDILLRTPMPRQVLSDRLRVLVGHGILYRHRYQEPGTRARDEYRLTDKGFDLYPVLVAVRDWGDRYLADPGGQVLALQHRDCGAQVHAELRCAAGHAVPPGRDVLPRPGPGARPRDDPPRSGDDRDPVHGSARGGQERVADRDLQVP
jgi:DNA-binding HxlR family transcriptional regulator